MGMKRSKASHRAAKSASPPDFRQRDHSDPFLSGFSTDTSGAVAAMYAMGLFALVGVTGVAFDYTRLATMHSELQNAADQAALAGATQLDGETGACTRAAGAAATLLSNETLLANDDGGLLVQIANTTTTCAPTDSISFYQDPDKSTLATREANARFISVTVAPRTANYALTPVVGAFHSGEIRATATAGMGSSICKVPPMMVCSPDPSEPFFPPLPIPTKGSDGAYRLPATEGAPP